jgi:hypothetical protein
MCYSDPTKSLDLARARLTPEQWKQFESDFQHFCDYSGLNVFNPNIPDGKVAWAKWAYLCGKGL